MAPRPGARPGVKAAPEQLGTAPPTAGGLPSGLAGLQPVSHGRLRGGHQPPLHCVPLDRTRTSQPSPAVGRGGFPTAQSGGVVGRWLSCATARVPFGGHCGGH